MKAVIGVFLTNTDVRKVCEWVKRLEGRAEFKIVEYEGFSQLESALLHMQYIDCAIFDLDGAVEWAKEKGLLTFGQAVVLSPGNQELYAQFFKLLKINPNYDFSRVLIDCPIEHVDETVFNIANRPVIVPKSMNEDHDWNNWEEQTLRKYFSAWESKCFDLVITRHVSLVGRLKGMGVSAVGLESGADSFFQCAEIAFGRIAMQKSRNNQPAFAVVGIRAGTQSLDQLRRSLWQFNSQYNHAFLITRRSGLFEIEVTRKILEDITDNYSSCKLLAFLKECSEHPISLGWGIGDDAMAARANAIRAYREAMFDERNIAYVADDEGYISPLQGQSNSYLRDDAISRKAEKLSWDTGVSKVTLKKIIDIIPRLQDNVITTQRLASELSVTRRTAARMLAGLEEKGIAVLAQAQTQSRPGRPVKCWKIVI